MGNPSEFTMLELAETIIELAGSRSGVIFHPLPEDDPRQRRPDISLRGKPWDGNRRFRSGKD